MFYEAIGLMATLLVLASFLVNDIKLVRTINIAGAAFFVAYGLLIGALSTWLLNAILVFVHIYHLVKMGDE